MRRSFLVLSAAVAVIAASKKVHGQDIPDLLCQEAGNDIVVSVDDANQQPHFTPPGNPDNQQYWAIKDGSLIFLGFVYDPNYRSTVDHGPMHPVTTWAFEGTIGLGDRPSLALIQFEDPRWRDAILITLDPDAVSMEHLTCRTWDASFDDFLKE